MQYFNPNWDLVPEHWQSTLKLYFERGHHPGAFGAALLSNDLIRAARLADDRNRECLASLAIFLWRFAPPESYGSPKNFRSWTGLRPREEDDEIES